MASVQRPALAASTPACGRNEVTFAGGRSSTAKPWGDRFSEHRRRLRLGRDGPRGRPRAPRSRRRTA
eukprot:15481895-Alexandrium_andersonii.AAC.1